MGDVPPVLGREDVLRRFPDYGTEGCVCGMHAMPDPECPLHFAIAYIERLEDEAGGLRAQLAMVRENEARMQEAGDRLEAGVERLRDGMAAVRTASDDQDRARRFRGGLEQLDRWERAISQIRDDWQARLAELEVEHDDA